MPEASFCIDWPGIRAAAVALNNVRAAARQAAANLPEPERTTLIERINKRALREGWLDQARIVQNVHRAETAMSKPVQTGAEIVQNSIAEHGKAAKIAGAEYAKLTMEHARETARTDPEKAIADAPNVKAILQGAAISCDWQGKPSSVAFININMLGVEPSHVIDVEQIE